MKFIKKTTTYLVLFLLFGSFSVCKAEETAEAGNPASGWLEIHLQGKDSDLTIVSPGNAYNWKPANWGAPGPRFFGVYPRSPEWTRGEVTLHSKTGGKLDLRFSAEPPVNRSRAPEHRREVSYRKIFFDGKELQPGKTFRASLWNICSIPVDLPANREVRVEFYYKTSPKRPPFKQKYAPEHAGRIMLDDFSDISTWAIVGRGVNNDPTLPSLPPDGKGFGSVPEPLRDDGFSGEVTFSFVKTGEMLFRKQSVFRRFFNAGAICFSAANNGYAATVNFDLIDANKKVFSHVCEVPLNSAQYKDYRVEISPDTVPGFDRIKFPVAIHQLRVLGPATNGKQTIRIDDLAFEVDSREYPGEMLKISPCYKNLLTAPGETIRTDYFIRSGLPHPATVKLNWRADNINGILHGEGKEEVTLAANSVQKCSFRVPASTVPQALACTVQAETGKFRTAYSGWIGVSTPNNGRINQRPMYFGAEDHGELNYRTEYKLHAQWYHELGIDMIRCDIYGAGFQPEADVSLQEFFRAKHCPYLENDILINVCFTGYFPRWTYSEEELKDPLYYAKMPKDENKIRSVIKTFAEFMKEDKHYRFMEIYNEPEFAFKDTTAEFMRGLKVISETMRETAPDVKLLSSGSVPCDWKEPAGFSEALYATTGPKYYDYAAFHAHGSLGSYQRAQRDMCNLLKKSGREVLFVQTESGERSNGNDPQLCMKQADTLVQKITYAKATGTVYYNWFTLCDYGDRLGDDSFGLITTGNQPKPAFLAYLELIRQLANTNPAGEWSPDDRLQGYRFQTETEDIVVLWPKIANQTFSCSLRTDEPIVCVDIFGKKTKLVPVNGLVFLTTEPHPFYLRSPRGALKHQPASLKQTGRKVFLPGERTHLNTTFVNRFLKPVDIRYNGKIVATALPVGQSVTLSQTVQIPGSAAPGKYADTAELEFIFPQDGLSMRTFCNLEYAVAHPIARKGQKTKPIHLNRQQDVQELVFLPELPVWQGPQDCSAILHFSYEGNFLIVKAEVTDNSFAAPNGWDGIWVNDSLQLGISDITGKRNLEFVLSGETPSGNESWKFAAPEGCPARRHCPTGFQFKRRGNRQYYSAKIPLAELKTIIKPGAVLRMAVAVTDNDILPQYPKGCRLRVLKWFDGVCGDKEPSKYGYLIFQ
ncbi:MAG: hypothetical protein IJW17_09230 [Lentisphaeria bacterium]|nr:hypothetical protein [Lentisphaeria bacterium]